jgi:excisionase family DNA binding protein
MERDAEAAEVARALRVSADSIGRYAREGRIPFDTTPGGHRRFNIDEVRLALDLRGGRPATSVFAVPAATVRARVIRSVHTTPAVAGPAPEAGHTAAGELLATAFRVQRSVPLTRA